MENPNKIEIEGFKTIHKLCNFGAEHDMEGCSFTEIVERMFSKIEQMKTQVNTLDDMLLNQGEVLTEAKTKAQVPEGFVLMPKEPNTQIVEAFWNSWLVECPNPQTIYFAYQAMIEAQEQVG